MSTKILGPQRWRIFYQSHNVGALPWAIDDGDIRNEMSFEKVLITVPAVTNQLAERKGYPDVSAWLEVDGVVEINGKVALVRSVGSGA